MSSAEYDFQDFVETEHLPSTFKVTSGYLSDKYDFAAGEVYTAEQVTCQKAVVQFSNKDTRRCVEIRLNLDFILKFQITCYDPERMDRTYQTVNDLRYVCPFLVQCGRDYKHPTNPEYSFSKGQKLRLMRFVNKNGDIELECRTMKGSKFIYLPMECRGNFTAVCNDQQYTISDLLGIFRRRCKLLLKLADHPVNVIHGDLLPVRTGGDIVLLEPRFDVVLGKEDSPGSKETVSLDIPLTVSPRQIDYTGPLTVHYGFEKYMEVNAFRLPFVVKVMDWNKDSNLFECHEIRPGIRLHVFEAKEVLKVLARSDDKFLSIPFSNETRFSVTPNRISGIGNALRKAPCTFKVVDTSSPRYDHYMKRPLKKGQIIRIPNSYTQIKVINGNEEEIVEADIFDESQKVFTSVYLPLFVDYTLEEMTPCDIITAKSIKGSNKVTHARQISRDENVSRIHDVTSQNESVMLCSCVEEDAVLVSTDINPTVSFHLHTNNGLQIILDRETTVMKTIPPLSPNDCCMQVISEERFIELLHTSSVYEQLYSTIPNAPPPFSPRKSEGGTHKRLVLPPVRVDQDPKNSADRKRLPPPPPPSNDSKQTNDEEESDAGDYVDMGNAPPIPSRSRERILSDPSGKAGPSEPSTSFNRSLSVGAESSKSPKTAVVKPTVKSTTKKVLASVRSGISSVLPKKEKHADHENLQKFNPLATRQKKETSIPEDGNLNGFSVEEMAKFLEAMDVTEQGVRAVYQHNIDGYRFGFLSDYDLKHLNMDNEVVRGFRDKTLRMRKAVTLPTQMK